MHATAHTEYKYLATQIIYSSPRKSQSCNCYNDLQLVKIQDTKLRANFSIFMRRCLFMAKNLVNSRTSENLVVIRCHVLHSRINRFLFVYLCYDIFSNSRFDVFVLPGRESSESCSSSSYRSWSFFHLFNRECSSMLYILFVIFIAELLKLLSLYGEISKRQFVQILLEFESKKTFFFSSEFIYLFVFYLKNKWKP